MSETFQDTKEFTEAILTAAVRKYMGMLGRKARSNDKKDPKKMKLRRENAIRNLKKAQKVRWK